MATEAELRECPFCKEEIKAAAVKCKHCHSALQPKTPPHGGVCPYCKEAIKPDAIKCKHCGSMIGDSPQAGCCGDCAEKGAGVPGQSIPSIFANLGREFGQLGTDHAPPGLPPGTTALQAGCSECVIGRIGRVIFSYRICCKVTWIPFLGTVKVCWFEPCGTIPDGTILT